MCWQFELKEKNSSWLHQHSCHLIEFLDHSGLLIRLTEFNQNKYILFSILKTYKFFYRNDKTANNKMPQGKKNPTLKFSPLGLFPSSIWFIRLFLLFPHLRFGSGLRWARGGCGIKNIINGMGGKVSQLRDWDWVIELLWTRKYCGFGASPYKILMTVI